MARGAGPSAVGIGARVEIPVRRSAVMPTEDVAAINQGGEIFILAHPSVTDECVARWVAFVSVLAELHPERVAANTRTGLRAVG